MGMSTKGFQTSARSGTHTALAEINVTPLVDVMLVLLIVFMISAPLMQQGVQVDLPKANAGTLSETPEQLTLVITPKKQILINGSAIQPGSLRARLDAIVAVKPELEVVIQGDAGVAYGFIAQVMAEVKRAGIHRVGLATSQADPNLAI
jgi:biopolymer transport protein TolR